MSIRVCAFRQSLRSFSTTPSSVRLAHDVYLPKESFSTKSPLVILHGLYGSKSNFRSLGESMANKLDRKVITLDLRNHGESPHKAGTSYEDHASDVRAFLKEQNLSQIALLGHSMGGKVAMTLALQQTPEIEKLVLVDISPAEGRISPDFARYIQAMQKIEQAKVFNKKEADAILQEYEESLPLRQFLLTNLIRKDGSEPYRFRISLEHILKSLDEIGKFPFTPGEVTFHKPTLFIKGETSKYINSRNMEVAKQYFPTMKLEVVPKVGHWVYSENPKLFQELLHDFLQ